MTMAAIRATNKSRRVAALVALLWAALLGAGHAAAQGVFLDDTGGARGPRIEELSTLDNQYMAGQRALLGDLAAVELGRRFSGERDRDLAILQALLDRGVVNGRQTRELQAMGIVMGDLLAAELDMHWVVYIDRIGRSRALRYRDSDEVLFPVTMISRRREVGNDDPVADIYRQARDKALANRQARPFQ